MREERALRKRPDSAGSPVLAARKRKARIVIRELKRLFPEVRPPLRHATPWELLVAVILSARCTDKMVNQVVATLFRKYRVLNDYARADSEALAEDIRATGFYRNKAKNIVASARIVRDRYGGQVPSTMEELLGLPGVARKTANVVLGQAFGVASGIAVDTHVRRLSRLLGLTDHTDPIKIEQDLMRIVPRSEWIGFSLRLIFYGRTYCPARPHDHAHCPLTRLVI
ncbi:MAG: endonuclease III [bacterium]